MQTGEGLSLEQIRAFLEGSDGVAFKGRKQQEVYAFVYQTLCQQRYEQLKRSGRGLARRYLAKITGLSRAQVTRLLRMYLQGEEVKPRPFGGHRFGRRYTREDIELLAAVDTAHETLSGPATQKLLYRAYHELGEKKCERLAKLSVAQLYRQGKSRGTGSNTSATSRRGRRRCPSGSGAGPIPKGGWVICGSTRCIKGTGRE